MICGGFDQGYGRSEAIIDACLGFQKTRGFYFLSPGTTLVELVAAKGA